MNTKHTQRGQALILIVLGIVGLVALVALAIDAGNAFSDRRHAQNAADATALAAALAKVRGGNLYAKGLAIADINDYHDEYPGAEASTPDVNVEIYNPPGAGCDGSVPNPVNLAADPNDLIEYYIQVIIHSNVDTFFAPILGINKLYNCVEAIARAKLAETEEMYLGYAVVALAPHGCDTMHFYGNAEVEVEGGGIFSNSNDTCGLNFGGNSEVEAEDGGIATVAPGFMVSGHPEIEPYPPATGAAPFPYPPPQGMLPIIECAGNATKTGDTMLPGNWTGTFPPNGVHTFQSGVYCINGDFRLNGGDDITGEDVVFVLNSGSIYWNGDAEINLDAPESGPYKGLLVYVPMSNEAELRLNGNMESEISGTILAPASHIKFSGDAETEAEHCQIIGYTVEFGGNGELEIEYEDKNNYDATIPPAIELAK